MTALQRFDDLTEPPVVGQYYLVRCVKGWWGWPYRAGLWPVWGSLHEDGRFLNFPWVHYHLNRFFLSESDACDAINGPLQIRRNNKEPGKNDALPEPVLRRLKCRQSVRDIRFPIARALAGRPAWRTMYDHFGGEQCKRGNGWVCPHKGFDLGVMAPDADGTITCPLHGLRINSVTGVVEK